MPGRRMSWMWSGNGCGRLARLGVVAALVVISALSAVGLAAAAGGARPSSAHRRARLARAGEAYGSCNWLGQLILVGFDHKTVGTELAAGQEIPISSNTRLFSLLLHHFGGKGTALFGLPDLQGKAPRGLHYLICTSGPLPARESSAVATRHSVAPPAPAAAPSGTASQDDDSCNYKGQVILVSYGFSFDGTVAADGQLLSTSAYPQLFALWRYKFGGGSVSQKFGVPDLQGKPPGGLQYRICSSGAFPRSTSESQWCNWSGQIVLDSFDVALDGTLSAGGEFIPIDRNEVLYSIFGNTFGVNQSEMTFGLPDLRDQAPPALYYRVCNSSGAFPSQNQLIERIVNDGSAFG